MNNNCYEPIILVPRSDIETGPDYDKCHIHNCGLCNQLFSLVNGIIKGYNRGCNVFVVDSFGFCVEKGTICRASEIFNYELMSEKMSNILGREIYFIDRTDIKLRVLSAKYGLYGVKTVDVTDILSNKIGHNVLKFQGNLNDIFGVDPLPNVVKNLYIEYDIGNKIIKESFPEQCVNIDYDTKSIDDMFRTEKSSWAWYNRYNVTLFNELCQCITFHPKLVKIVDLIRDELNMNAENYDVVHLRVEDDALDWWHKINHLDKDIFKHKLFEKYRGIINEYCGNNICLLTNATSDINELFPQATFTYIPKEKKEKLSAEILGFKGREINAIIDLMIGSDCKGIFVGCHNYHLSRGSTLSYILGLKQHKYKIMIDLDNIIADEIILI